MVWPERLAWTKRNVDELDAVLASRTAPAKRIAVARAVARIIREEDFRSGCKVIWRELMASRPEPGSTAEGDQTDYGISPSRSRRMRRRRCS
jgi:hypothetical protein